MAVKRPGDGTGIEWTQADSDRFDRYVGPADERGCREWLGGHRPGRYGKFALGGKSIGAHVFSFARGHGGDVPEVVRHSCDNPPCVEPTHLLSGTQLQNLLDARLRGRLPTARRRSGVQTPVRADVAGELNGRARLDEAAVVDIRARYGVGEAVTLRSLADEYGVCRSTVENVVHGKTWAHVI